MKLLMKQRILLSEIVEENDINEDDIISIIFSVTKELDAAFPAVAARQLGWTRCCINVYK